MKTNSHKYKDNYYPYIPCPVWVQTNGAKFYLADRVINISAPKELLREIISTCDGTKTINDVINILKIRWKEDVLDGFLANLIQLGVICNGVAISDYVWSFVKNPTSLFREISDQEILRLVRKAHKRHQQGVAELLYITTSSDLSDLIERRRSIRTFSINEVTDRIIVQMLWAGYGVVSDPLLIDDGSPQQIKVWQRHSLNRHTVPSAGALFPLKLSLCLFRPSGELKPGIYSVYFKEAHKVQLKMVNNDIGLILQSYADQTVCNNAQGVVIISGSFVISGEKYGNRALLYVPIEAGHVAQNIHLAASDSGIGTVEIGGFLEETLHHSLKLPKHYTPLTTILFGYPAEEKIKTVKDSSIDVRWTNPIFDGKYRLPFSMAFAKVKVDKCKEWSCGRANNPHIALTKAVSEAYEWNACGNIADDLILAAYNELQNAIRPEGIISYHAEQYKRKEFTPEPFCVNQKYFWKKAMNITQGREVYVLADCIYFPYSPVTPRYTYANSSGAAAHYDYGEAIKNATLELVERDAFMIVWLNQIRMPKISRNSLPESIIKRINALHKVGFRVVVKSFTLDLAPVVFVFAQSEDLPLTTCAACSTFDAEEALDHALMEVEAAVFCGLTSNSGKRIKPEEVRYTEDHGYLYHQRDYFRKADFLSAGRKIISLKEIENGAPRDWEELMARLDNIGRSLIVVDLAIPKEINPSEKLHIVKTFIPGVIPMSFGYGLEPCGMDRVYNLPFQMGYLSRRLSYSELSKHPHPYT